MAKITAKLLSDTQLAVFIEKSLTAGVKAPGDRWTPGVGLLDLDDPLLTDPCLINNKFSWCVITPPNRMLATTDVGSTLVGTLTDRGLLSF